MGVDYHALQLLRYSAKISDFGRVATIGRQSLALSEVRLRQLIELPPAYEHNEFCDSLLMDHFHAKSVESFDFSDYQGANHIVDMNQPLTKNFGPYDTVIDFGCLEHIYNIPQALKNVSEICGIGGTILHILPANNLCGHGFWQFSPELFFSLYDEEHGYANTKVFLADTSREGTWYEVMTPEPGHRIEVHSWVRMYIVCRTVKARDFSHDKVQQSDYIHKWTHGTAELAPNDSPAPSLLWTKLKARVQRPQLSRMVYLVRCMYANLRGDFSPKDQHREIIKRRIESLV